MSAWIRLDTESTFAGWTSELSDADFGTWTRLLLVMKLFGRGGSIERHKAEKHLLHANTSMESVVKLCAKSHGHITLDTVTLTVGKFGRYNPDPTNALRQAAYRNRADARNGDNASNGYNDDRTGQDTTLRDSARDTVTVPKELDALAFRVYGQTPIGIGEALTLHGADVVKAAILETAKREKKSWPYTEAILQRWAREGVPAPTLAATAGRAFGLVTNELEAPY
ncbi:MAG: DnaD domain protein [bacterium]